MTTELTPGDDWPGHYRGYRLYTNPDGDVWWQVYQGTDRLHIEPTPDALIEKLLDLKRLGGRVRITEDNDVITRVEEGDDYKQVYVGTVSLSGQLVPPDEPEYSVEIQPRDLSSGDLWPSVYDGAKFSFINDRIWWKNPTTHKRHPVETDLPSDVLGTLQRLKPRGGSFRVTPWGDVLTLVKDPPNPEEASEQLHNLPRVIKNIIVLRRERGVEMLPVYVGSVDKTPFEISEPRSLTDELSAEEQAKLNSWAGSVGQTTQTDPEEHRFQQSSDDSLPDDDDPETW
jgi:hypothetical protein